MDQIAETALPRLEPHGIVLSSGDTFGRRQRMAWRDLGEGLRLWRLGLTLGWLDIKLKYRGSLLGPFWLTLSTAVMIAALGGVYGTLFHMVLRTYLPFLALSLVLWGAIGNLVSESCNTFLQAETTIRSVRMPFFVYAVRVVVRIAIQLAHNLPVIALVFALFSAWPDMNAWLALPGFLLWLVDAFATCLLLGSVCARFRDIPPIIGSIMQIAFFVTPLVWRPEQLGAKGWWLPLNPFYSVLETVRMPLLGERPTAVVWEAAGAYSFLLCLASWMLFSRSRGRLAFWT